MLTHGMDLMQYVLVKIIRLDVFIFSAVSVFALVILYNIYFHPLRNFPGPWYLTGSDIFYAYTQLRGTSQWMLKDAHDKYGSVVRIAPNTLSFIEPEAWDEIYGYRKGTAALPKDPLFYNEMLLGSETITRASDTDAVPIRRAMNTAFSPKNLLSQSSMMREHMERLVSQLSIATTQSQVSGVDVHKWYTMSMFDINSQFGFGEDMGCVRNGKYHEWVQFVLDYFYAATLIHQCHKFWPLALLLTFCIPSSVRENQKLHNEASLERVRRRMDSKTHNQTDFMHHFSQHAKKEGLSLGVIESQASVVILAGSETSASGLSSATFYILRHLAIYQTLCDEIRGLFPTPASITLEDTLNKLPYLNAVIWETMRLHAPLANGFPRVVPAWQTDFKICGKHIPPSTVVTINHYCSNTSARNFSDPFRFAPERWLNDAAFLGDKLDVVQPFSVGPRNCPGRNFALNNMKLAMVYIILNFELELCEESLNWANGQKIYNGWMQPPLWVSLKRRDF